MPSFREAFRRGVPGRQPDQPPAPDTGPRVTFQEWLEQRIARVFDNPNPDPAINSERMTVLAQIRDAATPEERRQAVQRAKELGDVSEEEFTAIAEGRVPIIERPRTEVILEMAYRLKTGKLNGRLEDFQQASQQSPQENPPPSAELKNAADWWMAGRELLLKTYEDKERFTRDIARIKKEIKELVMKENLEMVAAKESELQRIENGLIATDILGLEANLKKIQEQLKVKLMDEFKNDKGAFMRANKEQFVAEFKRKHNIPEGTVFDEGQKDDALKALLKEEVKERLKKTISDTVYVFDEKFQQDRLQRLAEFQEKTRIQKMLERWNNLPLYKRLAISAVIAGGVGAFVFPMLPVVGGLFTVKGGLAATFAYKGARAALGGSVAFAANKAAQWLSRNTYGKKRGKLREERISATGSAIETEAQAAETAGIEWLEDEAAKLKFAEIADYFVDEQHKASEKLREKESNRRMWLAITVGAAAGMWSGLALDAATGGDIFGAPKRAKGWFGKWFGGEVAPGAPEAPVTKGAVLPKGIAVAPENWPVPEPSGGPGGPAGEDFTWPEQEPSGGPGGRAGIESVEPIGKRGIWGAVEEQLKKHLETRGVKWNDLNEAQRTWLTDYFKDEVVGENRAEFGVIDPDRPPAKIDFKDLFAGDSVDKALLRAKGLSPADMDSIVKNNAKIRDWVAQNPGKPLTMAQAEEILRGKPIPPAGPSGLADAPGSIKAYPPEAYEGGYGDQPRGATAAPEAPPPTAEAAPEAAPPPTPGGPDQGGGRVLPLEPGEGPKPGEAEGLAPAPEALPKVSDFGTVYETKIAEQYGFTPDQFQTTKGLTVEKLLKEIPIDKNEQILMWERFGQGKPPDLWPSGEPYYSSILQKQVKLAELLWTSFPRPDTNPELQKLPIGEIINRLRLGP